ncbi:hypothetical protein [Phaeobacter italicus]|uniref:hypothetical protein n=1 Tax=Phaeobacter italicus TaxID=481446 RepID=UPI001CD527D5|nr:hypothetical protein [Phaeobacter italicus]MCA0856130.1 hypothetical protein [Phaeobacter italicus]
MTTVKCGNKKCGKEFQARTADVKRGWGKFCSKSCKAVRQFKVTGISRPDFTASGLSVKQMQSGKYNKTMPPDPDNPSRARGTCAFCDAPAVNAYLTSFDDGELSEWSHRLRSHVVRFCDEYKFDAEMAVSYDGEF